MALIAWIPIEYRPLALFFLQIGFVSFVYTWVVLTIANSLGSVARKIRIPLDVTTLLTVTVGHGLLIAALVVINHGAVLREPEKSLLYLVLSALIFWILAAPQLFEDYAPSATRDLPRSRAWLYGRFVLLILWIALFCAAVIPQYPLMTFLFQKTDTLPWGLAEVIGLAGAYALLRSLFKAIFSTFGILGFLVKS